MKLEDSLLLTVFPHMKTHGIMEYTLQVIRDFRRYIPSIQDLARMFEEFLQTSMFRIILYIRSGYVNFHAKARFCPIPLL